MQSVEEKIKEAEKNSNGKPIDLSAIAGPGEETITPESQGSITGINLRKVLYYTPTMFKKLPREVWPVFKYKIPPGQWQLDLLDGEDDLVKDLDKVILNAHGSLSLSDTRIVAKATAKKKVAILKRCLKGWSNYFDQDGDPIEFETDENDNPTDMTLSSLDVQVADDLVEAISNRLYLTKEERVGLKF